LAFPEDFKVMRTREEIRSLFESIGYKYKLRKFNSMYNRAKEICNSYGDKCDVRGFAGCQRVASP
jgi:hypothetical protein